METYELVVDLGDRSYPIHIGRNQHNRLAELCGQLISENKKVTALVDQGLTQANPAFMDKFLAGTSYLAIPSGEMSKSVNWLSQAWDFLASEKVDRSGVLVVIGGGVTGDLGGFVASSYLRGISFVQIPTTLLAMVDSSVGGKTGVNIKAGKNLVGAFHQPLQVLIDLEVLKTLPAKEFSAGMAEIIKYGLLGNQALYKKLLDLTEPLSPSSPFLSKIIHQCCLDKAHIVQADERESATQGGRALLNLGHTFAHAIEAVAGYGHYLHGEAVAIGLVCAFRLSKKMGFCANGSEADLTSLLEAYNLPIMLEEPLSVTNLMNAMQNDKKVITGNLRFVLMKEIGSTFVEKSVDSTLVSDVLHTIGAS